MEILLLNLKLAGLMLLLQVSGCNTDLCNQARAVGNVAVQFAETTKINSVDIKPIVEIKPDVVITPIPVVPTLQPTPFGGIIKQMDKKVTISKYCVRDGSQPDLEQLGCNVNIEYTEDGQGIDGRTLTVTSNGQGQFVNYQSPQFVSTTTNELVIKTKNKGKQTLLYIQPNLNQPTFTVEVEGITQTTN